MPLITVSRTYGSGGSLVAAEVAKQLGWTLLDNAVVEEVAHRLGLPVAEVEAREERPPSLVERIVTALSLGSPEALPASPEGLPPSGEEQLLEVTRRVIEEVVERGPAVIVGRGAHVMLASRPDALHVLCHCPRGAALERVRERLGIGAAEAERKIQEMNRSREQWVRRHWQRDWLSATNYHLCVNTGWLGVDGAVEMIVRAARERMPG